MDCSPAAIARASRCYCLPDDRQRAALLWLACAWATAVTVPVTTPVTTSDIILSNGTGGFCRLVVDILGNVGAVVDAGPATATVPVIADGVGGFWQIVTDAVCDRGTTSVAGPATAAVVLLDANSVAWTLVADGTGNLGATS